MIKTSGSKKIKVSGVISLPQCIKDQIESIATIENKLTRQIKAGQEQLLPQWLKRRKTSFGKDSKVR